MFNTSPTSQEALAQMKSDPVNRSGKMLASKLLLLALFVGFFFWPLLALFRAADFAQTNENPTCPFGRHERLSPPSMGSDHWWPAWDDSDPGEWAEPWTDLEMSDTETTTKTQRVPVTGHVPLG